MRVQRLRSIAASGARGIVGSVLLFGAIHQGFAASPKVSVSSSLAEQDAVTVQAVRLRPGIETHVLWGAVTADDRASLGFTVSGRIRRVSAEVGERVRRGQTLVALDASGFQHGLRGAEADLARQRAALNQLVRQRERVDALSRVGIATSEEAERVDSGETQARAAIEAATAQREEMDRLVAESTLRAPFPGVVVAVHAHPGEIAAPGAPMVVIVADRGTLEIEADVPDVYASSVHVDEVVSVYSRDERAYQARVVAVANAATAGSTRLLRTRFELLDSSHRLEPGQTVRIHLQTVTAPAIFAPLAAVLDPTGDSPYVYVVRDGVARRRQVELGDLEGDDVEIASGLEAGEEVVVGGRALLLPEQRVRVAVSPESEVVAHGEGIASTEASHD